MRLAALLCVSLIVALEACGTGGPDWSDPAHEFADAKPFIGRTFTDSNPLRIIASGQSLSIPRNYVDTLVNDHGKVMFGLFTLFPAFQGATDATKDSFLFRNRFKIKNGIKIFRRTDLNSSYLCCTKHFVDEFDREGFLDAGNDLEVRRTGYVSTFLHRGQPVEQSVAILCSGEDPYGCLTTIEPLPGIVIEVTYNIDLVPEWKSIDLGVRRMVQSFANNAQHTQSGAVGKQHFEAVL